MCARFSGNFFYWGGKRIIACDLRGAAFSAADDPGCQDFLGVVVVLEPGNFSNVNGCSFCNVGISFGDIAEKSFDFSVLHMFLCMILMVQLIILFNHHAPYMSITQIQVISCNLESDLPWNVEILHHPSGKVVVEKHHHWNFWKGRFVVWVPHQLLASLVRWMMFNGHVRRYILPFTTGLKRQNGWSIVANNKINEWQVQITICASSSFSIFYYHRCFFIFSTVYVQYGTPSDAERQGIYIYIVWFLIGLFYPLWLSNFRRQYSPKVNFGHCDWLAKLQRYVPTFHHCWQICWQWLALVMLYYFSIICGEALKKQEENWQLCNFCVDSFAQQMLTFFQMKTLSSRLQSEQTLNCSYWKSGRLWPWNLHWWRDGSKRNRLKQRKWA